MNFVHGEMTWFVDGRWLAQEVRNAGEVTACDVSHDWPGLPAGVKFDPSDVELLQHLAAKCGEGNLQPHEFINEFIPTLDDDEGICYTHPETLPGAKKDGRCIHFFYKVTNAYTTGARKRRRIEDANVRWHKTGKTKRIVAENKLKGFKKIMVLQGTSAPEKCRWVMHQYHLGSKEDEKEGEYVVSKIFYQPQNKADKDKISVVLSSESEMGTVEVIPRTIMNISQPSLESFGQEKENQKKSFDHPLYGAWSENPCRFGDLDDDLELHTRPGFQLHDLQFAQLQDTVSDWLDLL